MTLKEIDLNTINERWSQPVRLAATTEQGAEIVCQLYTDIRQLISHIKELEKEIAVLRSTLG